MTYQLQPDTFTHEWDSFTDWLTERGVDPSSPLTPIVVATYLRLAVRGGPRPREDRYSPPGDTRPP